MLRCQAVPKIHATMASDSTRISSIDNTKDKREKEIYVGLARIVYGSVNAENTDIGKVRCCHNAERSSMCRHD